MAAEFDPLPNAKTMIQAAARVAQTVAQVLANSTARGDGLVISPT
jgi:hypothetical protein